MDAELFLSNIISTLSNSDDFSTSIDQLAQLATQGLADWCGIFAFENEQAVRRLSVRPTRQTETLFPLDLHALSGPAYVRRTGEPQLLSDPDIDIAEGLGMKSSELLMPDGRRPAVYACLPAIARQQTIGAVVFMSSLPQREFTVTNLSLAMSLANAAAVAIDNSNLYREAQGANRLKDEFVATVSHELRTPLTPILGCIHLLRTTKPSTGNFNRALDLIERNAKAQVQIVEDLLDVCRIVAGKLHLTMKSTPLIPVVEAAIETIQSSAETKGIKIFTDFENPPISVDGDPHRLQQIVWNLLSNAVKFTPADGQINISLRCTDAYTQIEVTDTGVGIPAEFLPHIFNRLRQSSESSSVMRSGLGLGLAIVRHLVELHSGSIEAASAGRNKGSVFTIKFPLSSRRVAVASAGTEG